jgi:hypothetical protein
MTDSIFDSDFASFSSELTALQATILLRSWRPRDTVISEWVMYPPSGLGTMFDLSAARDSLPTVQWMEAAGLELEVEQE